MIQTDTNKNSLKALRKIEKQEEENILKAKCEALASERYGVEELKKMSNANKGIWYLPVSNEDGEIEALALMKPIDRHILSYASTKMTEEGLYAFLESAMRSCFIVGDEKIMDDDEYFIPAANVFNKILEGKNASLLKR